MPKPAAAAQSTSASTSSSATGQCGSGTSPIKLFPAATQIVDLYHAREHVHDLASLATRLLRSDGRRAGSPNGSPNSTPATSPPCSPPATHSTSSAALARERDKATRLLRGQRPPHALRPLPPARACSSAPAPSKQAAKPSSASGSNSPACAGPSPAPPASLTLRCQQASNRWEEIWQRPHNQTQAADLARQAS